MNKRVSTLFGVLMLMALLAGACAAPEPVAEAPVLKVGWSLWPGSYPIAIAHEKGFFEKHGVQVEPVLFTNASEHLASYTTKTADGALFALGDALLVLAQDSSGKITLITDYSDGGDVMVGAADIASVADLKGKTIGCTLGTFSEFFAREMLTVNGLDTGDVTLVNLDPTLVPESLGRDVAAGHTWGPYIGQSQEKGGQILFSTSDTPGLIPDVLLWNAEVVDAHPEAIRAFNAAWFEALAWWQENPEEAADILAAATGLTPGDISAEGVALLDQSGNQVAFTPAEETTSIHFTSQKYIDFLMESGMLSKPIDMQVILDSSFIQ